MWAMNGCLPVAFYNAHLLSKFKRSEEVDIQAIRSAGMAYDEKYPEAQGIRPLCLTSATLHFFQQLLGPPILVLL